MYILAYGHHSVIVLISWMCFFTVGRLFLENGVGEYHSSHLKKWVYICKALFLSTFVLSCTLLELVTFEVLDIINPSLRQLLWTMSFAVLCLLLNVLIPGVLAATICVHLDIPRLLTCAVSFCSLFTIHVFSVLFREVLPLQKPSVGSMPNSMFLFDIQSSISLIAIAGTAIAATITGFATVSFPMDQFFVVGNVDLSLIAGRQSFLKSIVSAVFKKKKALFFLHQKLALESLTSGFINEPLSYVESPVRRVENSNSSDAGGMTTPVSSPSVCSPMARQMAAGNEEGVEEEDRWPIVSGVLYRGARPMPSSPAWRSVMSPDVSSVSDRMQPNDCTLGYADHRSNSSSMAKLSSYISSIYQCIMSCYESSGQWYQKWAKLSFPPRMVTKLLRSSCYTCYVRAKLLCIGSFQKFNSNWFGIRSRPRHMPGNDRGSPTCNLPSKPGRIGNIASSFKIQVRACCTKMFSMCKFGSSKSPNDRLFPSMDERVRDKLEEDAALLEREIDGLESLSEDLFLEIVCMRESCEKAAVAATRWGQMLRVSGQILTVIGIFKCIIGCWRVGMFVIFGRFETVSQQADNVTSFLAFALVYLKLNLDSNTWSPLLGSLYVGLMALLHIRAFIISIQQFAKLGLLNTSTEIYSLVLAYMAGAYCVAGVLFLRTQLPLYRRRGVTAAIGENIILDFYFWLFDVIFILSTIVSIVYFSIDFQRKKRLHDVTASVKI